jgi:hypothetical protein
MSLLPRSSEFAGVVGPKANWAGLTANLGGPKATWFSENGGLLLTRWGETEAGELGAEYKPINRRKAQSHVRSNPRFTFCIPDHRHRVCCGCCN